MPIWLTFCIGRSVHYASVGDWVDQNRRRRLRQAVLGHVQGVLGQNGVPWRCHCSNPALHIYLQVGDKPRRPFTITQCTYARSWTGLSCNLNLCSSFRDYEVLNHGLLQTLVEKVRALEENTGRRALSYGSESEEESLRDYSWVFDEVDSKMDPTYVLPPERSPQTRRRNDAVVVEEIGENYIATSVSLKYNLRPRK